MQNADVCSPLSCFETEVWMSSYSQPLHRLRFVYDATHMCWVQSLWGKSHKTSYWIIQTDSKQKHDKVEQLINSHFVCSCLLFSLDGPFSFWMTYI